MAEQKPKAAKLEDIISYAPASYYSDDDLAVMRAHFGGDAGAKVIELVRKVLLPTMQDPGLPLENMSQDLFMGLVDFKNVPADEAKALAMGLQYLNKGIAGGLVQLRTLANTAPESPQQKAARIAADSSK